MQFIFFLLTVLSIYSSWNYYFYSKLKNSLILNEIFLPYIKIGILFFVFSPILLKFIEKCGLLKLSKIFAYPVYIWMCYIFLFLVFGLIIELLKFAGIIISEKYTLIIPFILSAILIVYGYHEANQIELNVVTIKTQKKIHQNNPLKILQISDVHLGIIVGEKKLLKIANIIKTAKPDILVCTGDLVDGDFFNENILKDILLNIKPKYGKFAITGNHEYYAGISKSIEFIKESGFNLLMNECIKIPKIINIIGINDPTHYRIKASSKEIDFSSYDENLFTIFLRHQPNFNYYNEKPIDLELSGHTHKGQIFPFNLITYLFHPIKSGKLIYKNNRFIYVSKGTGTWGPPVRFLAKPEVTLFEVFN